jgi:hypothetical protein
VSRLVSAVLVTLLVVATAGCSRKNTNVVPPEPGVPARVGDIVGIYRTVEGSLLQLRKSGEFLILAGERPIDGRFTLVDGRVTMQADSCGEQVGHYDVRVTGKAEPNKAQLRFAVVDDACAARRAPLVDQRWVYVES